VKSTLKSLYLGFFSRSRNALLSCFTNVLQRAFKKSRNLGVASSVNWTRSTFKHLVLLQLIIIIPSVHASFTKRHVEWISHVCSHFRRLRFWFQPADQLS
jgi:hypothetical protein